MGQRSSNAPGSGRRVLFVTSNFPRWRGDSTTPFILHLAQDLQTHGWSVRVLAPHADGASTSEVLDGVSVERFRYWWPVAAQTVCYQGGALINLRRRKSNAAKVPALVAAEFAATLRRLAGHGIDVVHSHWLLPQGFVAGLAARVLSVPHVTTIHGGDVFALRGVVLTRFKQAALRLSDAITVNSSATEEAARRILDCGARLHRIPMGASVPPAADPGQITEIRGRYRRGDGPMLVFVGRLIEEKGIADLLEAMASLVPALPDVTALIIGEGPDKSRFMAQAGELGLSDRVVFTGWLDPADVSAHLQSADIFVGPSKRSPDGWVEAQGIVYAEAMMSRVPVIACDIGGVADLVQHARTGLLVPESSPAEIANAIQRLWRDDALRRRVIEDAHRRTLGEFSRQASAARFSTVYEGLLGQRLMRPGPRRNSGT